MRAFILAAAIALCLTFPARADPPGAAVTTVPSGAPGQALPFLQSTAAEASHIFKGGPGNLYAVGATSKTTPGYLMLIDGTTVPSDGALTSCGSAHPAGCLNWCGPIGDGSSGSPAAYTGFQLSPGPPMPFVNGIIAVFSTTGCTSKTLGATSVFFEAQVY